MSCMKFGSNFEKKETCGPRMRPRSVTYYQPSYLFDETITFDTGPIAAWRLQSKRTADVDTGESAKGELNQDVVPVQDSTEGTVQFLNETESATLRPDDTIVDNYRRDLAVGTDLTDFFTRPVRLYTYRWAENLSGNDLYSSYVWSQFFLDARVKKKLDNFAYINCNLKLKFVINASPFYYGALKAVYTPLVGYGASKLDGGTDSARKVLQSQMYTVDLNPQEGSSAEMVLPFIHFKNWLRVDSASEFADMGSLTLVQYATLRSANGVTGAGVDVTVYACAENIQLSGPTAALALQSKRTSGYKPNGWISGPASAVAAAAGELTRIPVIAPFARATDMAASALAGVADIFGFTNAPVISDVMPIKNLPFGNLSGGEISEPAAKLTMDPKQELSIDSRTAGFDGSDELVISNLVQKESFLCGSLWRTTDATDTILFTARITPNMHDQVSDTAVRRIYATPMCHVAQMFRFWRGDMIFRLKFIRTQYHRGRVRITWDPIADITANVDTSNTNFTVVLDLEEQDELELRVPYMAAQPFLDISAAYPINWSNGTAPALVPDVAQHNGLFQVRVLNNLTAPELTSDIDMLVYVRGAENMEFAVPRTIDSGNTFYALQSRREPISMAQQAHKPDDKQHLVNFGEKFTSLRDILHRSSLGAVIPLGGSGNQGYKGFNSYTFRRVPRATGFDPNGLQFAVSKIATGNKPYNFVPVHPITWVSSMFIGQTGSTTVNINVDTGSAGGDVAGDLRIAPGMFSPGVGSTTNAPIDVSKIVSAATYFNVGTGAAGLALTNQLTQAGLSANLPNYNRGRFYVNSIADLTNGKASDNSNADNFTVFRSYTGRTDVNLSLLYLYYCSGPDFNLFGFLSTPVIYRVNTAVAAPAGA